MNAKPRNFLHTLCAAIDRAAVEAAANGGRLDMVEVPVSLLGDIKDLLECSRLDIGRAISLHGESLAGGKDHDCREAFFKKNFSKPLTSIAMLSEHASVLTPIEAKVAFLYQHGIDVNREKHRARDKSRNALLAEYVSNGRERARLNPLCHTREDHDAFLILRARDAVIEGELKALGVTPPTRAGIDFPHNADDGPDTAATPATGGDIDARAATLQSEYDEISREIGRIHGRPRLTLKLSAETQKRLDELEAREVAIVDAMARLGRAITITRHAQAGAARDRRADFLNAN